MEATSLPSISTSISSTSTSTSDVLSTVVLQSSGNLSCDPANINQSHHSRTSTHHRSTAKHSGRPRSSTNNLSKPINPSTNQLKIVPVVDSSRPNSPAVNQSSRRPVNHSANGPFSRSISPVVNRSTTSRPNSPAVSQSRSRSYSRPTSPAVNNSTNVNRSTSRPNSPAVNQSTGRSYSRPTSPAVNHSTYSRSISPVVNQSTNSRPSVTQCGPTVNRSTNQPGTVSSGHSIPTAHRLHNQTGSLPRNSHPLQTAHSSGRKCSSIHV